MRVRRFAAAAVVRQFAAAALLVSTVAHADAFDHLAEGGAFYGEVRPVALFGALKRAGLDQLPQAQKLKQQVGIDPFDPAILAPSGLDVSSPVAAAVELSPAGGFTHLRLVGTVRDQTLFRAFVGAIAASKQSPLEVVDPATPLGKAGVLVTAALPDQATAIARIDGDAAIVDVVDTWNDVAMKPAEIARRWPLAVPAAFSAARGARRLFAVDTALAFYADGRRFGDVLEAIGRMDLEDELQQAKKSERARLKQKRTAELKRCTAEWRRAPSTFDDMAVALGADAKELRLSLAWGTLSGPPLGGLRFSPVDDAGVDTAFLARQAPFMAALFAASLKPFTALARSGIYQSVDAMSAFGKRCGDQVNVGIAMRGWPLAIGAAVGDLGKPQAAASAFDVGTALSLFGNLRNLVVVGRDASAQSVQFAVAATLDVSARPLLETLLGAVGASGAQKPFGKRTPTVYSIANPSIGSFSAGLETLAGGPLLFTFADSDESLQFVYRAPKLMPGATPPPAPASTPILAVHVDGATAARLLTSSGAGDGARPAIELMNRVQRLDADLATDGDLFRLTVRAPLK